MAKNKIVWKNDRPGSNKSNWRDYAYDKAFQKKPEQVKKRMELNKLARKKGIYGKRNKMWKDLSHTKSWKIVLEDKSKNRARQGSNGKSTLK
jgi:hypothetical protein